MLSEEGGGVGVSERHQPQLQLLQPLETTKQDIVLWLQSHSVAVQNVDMSLQDLLLTAKCTCAGAKPGGVNYIYSLH